jgi:hypothetical protein
VTYYHKDKNGDPADGAMTPEEVGELVDHLLYMDEQGYYIVTWNGLGFDFDVLAEESGRWQECRDLALRHVDMMFHFLCKKGFPLGLNTAAHGLGLPGKTEGMHGDLAPVMWAKSLDDRRKVLEYVAQDAVTTLQVAEKAQENKAIQWVSKTGRTNLFQFDKWLTVKDALLLPPPDTSWMTNPMQRYNFYGWTGYELP